MIYSVYCRHHSSYIEEESSIEEAIKTVQWGEEYGELSGVGAVDTDKKEAWISIIEENDMACGLEALKEMMKIDISGYSVKSFHSFPD